MRGVVVGLLSLILFTNIAVAEPSEPDSNQPTVALVGFDALGMDEERVQRLETLFLKELERLTGKAVPSRRAIAQLSRKLRRCEGTNKCLAAIGTALDVSFVVSGNVASLGDSYVLNIKAVAAGTGQELRRIESDPLRGQPDELIEAIRVAAYRLLSPGELLGALSILADRAGARIELDGNFIGETPLDQPITRLSLGTHKLKVDAGEFGEFSSDVRVRFQKTTRVVVNLVDLRIKEVPEDTSTEEQTVIVVKDAPQRWYQKTWFLVSAGVGVAVVGGIIGYSLAQDSIVNCDKDPVQCMP